MLLLLTLVGCAMEPQYETVDPPAGEARAIKLIKNTFDYRSGRTGMMVQHIEPVVYWSKPECTSRSHKPGVWSGNLCVGGVMFGCDEIYVAYDGQPIYNSALAHELAHCFLMDGGLGADPSHKLHPYWDIVTVANDFLYANDI